MNQLFWSARRFIGIARGARSVAAWGLALTTLGLRPAASPGMHAIPEPPLVLLLPTGVAPGATGIVRMTPAASAFGVAVAVDGRPIYDLDVSVTIGAAPADLGAYTAYVVWVDSPAIDSPRRLGAIARTGRITGRAELNKFLVIVSAEATASVERRSGPVVLRGISPSGLLQSFRGHSLFETAH